MSGWISAINPFSTAKTIPDARRAARASALAIGIGVVWALWRLIDQFLGSGTEVMRDAMAQGMGAAPNAEAMIDIMMPLVLGLSVVTVIVQAVLGLVQWFRPNFVIPVLFLGLTVFGLMSMVRAFVMVQQMHMTIPDVPLWQTVVGWSLMALQTILHIAGLRGARALSKLT